MDDLAELDSMSLEDLEKIYRENAERTRKLKDDIKLLKSRQFQPRNAPDKDYEACLKGSSASVSTAKDQLRKDVQLYENKLMETVRLTGITLDKFDKDVQFSEESDTQCFTDYALEMTVYDRRVRLFCKEDMDFYTSESQPGQGKVSWFQIQFEEDIHRAIGEQIVQAAKKTALHSAVAFLKSYLKWENERKRLTARMLDSYPNVVTLEESGADNYCLRISKPNRPTFIVEWNKKTVAETIVSDTKLKVDADEKWAEMDSVIDSAPQAFDLMVKTFGLEQALEALVQLMITDGKTLPTPDPSSQPAG